MATTPESITNYEAVTRDDPQFDGKFFTAVMTTGIFCRPMCSAPTPRPENVRFFATAAAAAESGFRPCLKCRPESAPDPTQWQNTCPVVARALRFISQGFLDHSTVEELAAQLRISPRQLRRIFLDEIGAPPVAVAQTRRLLFAKKLIDETPLSMADVAFSAGYGSIRRFNDAIRQTYGRTPSQIRRQRKRSMADPAGSMVALKLFYRDPYNWPAMMSFLREHAIPHVEQVTDDLYRRAVSIDGITGIIEVQPLPAERAVLARVPSNLARQLLPVTEHIKDIFDLRADPVQIESDLTAADPLLAPVVNQQGGMRVPGVWDGFELAVRAILNKASGSDGEQLLSTLVRQFGEPVSNGYDLGLSRVFPSPERLVAADLGELGIPHAQSAAIQRLARVVLDGSLDFGRTADPETVVDQIGNLTGMPEACYIVMRSAGDPDMKPDGIPWPEKVLLAEEPLMRNELLIRSNQWRPWRSYAAMHLWAGQAENVPPSLPSGPPIHAQG